jgi:hypothetical protein
MWQQELCQTLEGWKSATRELSKGFLSFRELAALGTFY